MHIVSSTKRDCAAPCLVRRGGQDAGAGGSDRVSERNARAVRVDPVVERVELPFGQHCQHLRGEGLVELDEVDRRRA